MNAILLAVTLAAASPSPVAKANFDRGEKALEGQQYDVAIAKYQHVARQGDPASQRAEGLWRVGWVYYRTGRFREAADSFRALDEQHDSEF